MQIGVMGSAADLKYSKDALECAKQLGKLIAQSGNILVYGAEKEYKRCKVLGRIGMKNFVIDLSNIDAKINDAVKIDVGLTLCNSEIGIYITPFSSSNQDNIFDNALIKFSSPLFGSDKKQSKHPLSIIALNTPSISGFLSIILNVAISHSLLYFCFK